MTNFDCLSEALSLHKGYGCFCSVTENCSFKYPVIASTKSLSVAPCPCSGFFPKLLLYYQMVWLDIAEYVHDVSVITLNLFDNLIMSSLTLNLILLKLFTTQMRSQSAFLSKNFSLTVV